MKNYLSLLIVVTVIAVVFGILWRMGHLIRIRDYVNETREELRKCTWPNWDELKGSTVLVMVAIFVLGGFTVVADLVVASLVHWIM
jgi:preprotein translocase subunit SecE